jgi:ABC-type sugar transport system ATPase subunit
VRGLCKQFAGAQALREVDFDLRAGEVQGLVGANGAGKSTMIRCLAGLVQPDRGTIRIDGEEVLIGSPIEATELGLAFIHQELHLVPHFNAMQNILLGARKRTRFGMINWRATRRLLDEVVERLGIAFPLDSRVDELSVSERWMVSIARATVGRARLVAMDEPTASMTDAESERLHRLIREMAADGISVIYVSHRLTELPGLCDRISVFRDGRMVRRVGGQELGRGGLVAEIVGRDIEPPVREEVELEPGLGDGSRPSAPIEIRKVSRSGAVREVSFSLPRNEIVGLAGLAGAGRTELARLLAGVDRMSGGEVLIDGTPADTRSVSAAIRSGIALVPEERRSEGLLLDQSVAFNVNIADPRPVRVLPWIPIVHRGRSRRRAERLANELAVKLRSVDQPVRELSGGNQQKVLIARWLTRPLKLLIFDEPSRGVDVAARAEIHALMRALVKQGTAILVISSDTEELVELCDRIVVMSAGRVAGELARSEVSSAEVTQLSYRYTDDRIEALP